MGRTGGELGWRGAGSGPAQPDKSAAVASIKDKNRKIIPLLMANFRIIR
jgi:hypothetical protein